jgi:16S rRNA (uracil1498-N3)-methyltransferase
MRRRFFVEEFQGGRAVLRGDAAHHAGRVLRAEPGQLYELSDGEQVWLGRIERVRREEVEFSLIEPLPAVSSARELILVLSIVKFDRFEWALEKATELGVAEVIPLAAARSEKGLVAAAEKRARRWEKILLEAAQQSRRLRPPCLRPLERRSVDFLRGAAGVPALGKEPVAATGVCNSAPRLFFSEERDAPPLRTVLQRAAGAKAVSLAFGPEGGWTEEERCAARAGQWAEVSLGANILRTETAVLAALAIVNYAWGEF